MGPDWMSEERSTMCGQSISYEELATKFSIVTGIETAYRHCSVEEFRTLQGGNSVTSIETRELGE